MPTPITRLIQELATDYSYLTRSWFLCPKICEEFANKLKTTHPQLMLVSIKQLCDIKALTPHGFIGKLNPSKITRALKDTPCTVNFHFLSTENDYEWANHLFVYSESDGKFYDTYNLNGFNQLIQSKYIKAQMLLQYNHIANLYARIVGVTTLFNFTYSIDYAADTISFFINGRHTQNTRLTVYLSLLDQFVTNPL